METIATVRACARGCEFYDDEQSVDVPVQAELGLLCRRCYDRLWWRLGDVPLVLEQALRALVPASGAGERVGGTKDHDVLNAQAMEDADELWAVLTAWGTSWASSTGIARPAVLSTLLAAERDAVGISVRATPSQAGREAHTVTQWLQSHLESLAYQSQIADCHDEIVPLVAKLRARYGLVNERRHTYRRRSCEVCTTGTIGVTWREGELEVKCRQCWTEWEVPAHLLAEIVEGESE